MREILFRGKGKYNDKEWVYGNLIKTKNDKFWITNNSYSNGGWLALTRRVEVEKETVGQFTGLLDKNGKMIFEGDIIKLKNKNYKVVFKNYYWTLDNFYNSSFDIPTHAFSELEQQDLEVIGNIHDNGELYKESKGEIRNE